MNTNTEMTITELRAEELVEVSALLANSMSTNPNHLAIFKSTDPRVVKKQRKMFEMVLKDPDNRTFTAKINNRIVGTMTYTTSDHCQIRPLDLIRTLPGLITMFGMHLLPVLRWRMNWGKHDYRQQHSHFGPLAVDTVYQGRGIGKGLLTHYCKYLDATNQAGYLETDKAENVALYQKFGFRIIETDRVSGVENWFMVRK